MIGKLPEKKKLLPHQQSKGVPVDEGQTWQDLSPEQRRQYFIEHEQRWKRKYSTNGTKQSFHRG